MTAPRFLQIHTLHSYTASLLNRDEAGQAKRLVYGGTPRTRISSQCLKRHWRMAEHDPYALQKLSGYVESFRSRDLVTQLVSGPLRARFEHEIVDAIEAGFQRFIYGPKGDQGRKTRAPLLLGQPELNWLARNAEEIAMKCESPKAARQAVDALTKTANFKVMAQSAALPGGLTAALFGRMVTSDVEANIEAPIYVAHAFSVHEAEVEGDFFSAVDDLAVLPSVRTTDTLQQTEIGNGLFYGYVVIDMPGLIRNCAGDRALAGSVVRSLIHLIAEVSPGAKRGSTAPFGRADLVLLEAGDRQPRSLATAYRVAIPHCPEVAIDKLAEELRMQDEAYATNEERAHLSIRTPLPEVTRFSIGALADWGAGIVSRVEA